MNFFHIIILSIVEGITEFLPISSTFHIDLTAKLLHISHSEFLTSFMIAIQLGAILAIIVLMKQYLFHSLKTWIHIGIAFIPVGLVGFFAYPIIKNFLLGNIIIEIIAVLFGGIIMILFAKKYQQESTGNVESKEVYSFSLKELVLLGCWQILGLIPGMSRSGSIIIGGLVNKMPIQKIVVASFLLAIPTMTIATGFDLLKTGFVFTTNQWMSIIWGIIFSGIIAYFVARWLLRFVQKPNALYLFGWYRIILGVILTIIFIL
jgi:undecaprenyl-diphosphatase